MSHWSDGKPWTRIDVEDVSDCDTCTRREEEFFELLGEHRVKALGQVACHECGRTYEAVGYDEIGFE